MMPKKWQVFCKQKTALFEWSGACSIIQLFPSAVHKKSQSTVGKFGRDFDEVIRQTRNRNYERGFTAVHNIIAKFFEARKTSSMALPSNDAFLAMESDSQGFLTSNFERINNAAEKFIREGKDGNAAYIIDIYGSLAKKAKEIEFVGGRVIENPTFDHVIRLSELVN